MPSTLKCWGFGMLNFHIDCSLVFSFFCFYLGYDVSTSPRPGLSSFSPSSTPWPKTTEHSGDQQWTNKTGWLRPCPHLQFSDGSYLSGEWESALFSLNLFFLFWMTNCPPFHTPLIITASGQLVDKMSALFYMAVGRRKAFSLRLKTHPDWACCGQDPLQK